MKKHKRANRHVHSVFLELLWWAGLPLAIVLISLWLAPLLGVR